MILRRLGNKKLMASKIIPHFPKHVVYNEPFFGAGGMYFNKPRAKYSFLNDLDQDVFNLFLVVKDHLEELLFLFKATPLHEGVFYHFVNNEETDPVKKALRFLFISSFSYMGKSDMFRLLHSEVVYKEKLIKLINQCSDLFKNSVLRNKDFRVFFDGIQDPDSNIGKKDRFTYADPPYLDTGNNYSTPKWTEKDVVDLFNCLDKTKIRYAYSEFDHPFIIDQADLRDLNVITIGERRNLKNKRVEILITNYESPNKLMF